MWTCVQAKPVSDKEEAALRRSRADVREEKMTMAGTASILVKPGISCFGDSGVYVAGRTRTGPAKVTMPLRWLPPTVYF
jgi:hypothetical protein